MAIIHAFTALWEIKFEQMTVILNFCQKMNDNDNECKKIILKSWTKLKITAICSIFIFQRAVKAWIIANYIDFTILAIIQAFTALWKIKIEQMTVILSLIMIFLQSLSLQFIFGQTFKMTTICSNFISQRAIKAWIIANCIDFIIYVFALMIF